MVASKSKLVRRFPKKCLGTRLTSLLQIAKFGSKKHCQKRSRRALVATKNVDENREDYFNRLSDDLLCELISRLNSRDAIRTGILSKRWNNLWREVSLKHLYFKAQCMPGPKTREFASQVTAFLVSRCGTEVESMTASCFLPNRHQQRKFLDFSCWFAVKNKVQTMDLNLSMGMPENLWLFTPYLMYHGPGNEISIKHLSLSSCFLQSNMGHQLAYKSLLSVTLKRAHVSNIELDRLLRGCLSLECLSFEECHGLEYFEYENHIEPLRLKHLSILNCEDMKWVDVSEAKCLVSLTYIGNVLDELYCENSDSTVKRVTLHVSNYDPKHLDSLAIDFPYLETLSLRQPFTNGSENLPTFFSIKILELVLVHQHLDNLWPQISNILKASPSLNKLELRFPMLHGKNHRINKIAYSEDNQFVNLKEVVVYYFRGQAREVELILKKIVNCANSIEKIDIHQQPHRHNYSFTKLAQTLPPTIKLQVF